VADEGKNQGRGQVRNGEHMEPSRINAAILNCPLGRGCARDILSRYTVNGKLNGRNVLAYGKHERVRRSRQVLTHSLKKG
jgi:hypothetical protein